MQCYTKKDISNNENWKYNLNVLKSHTTNATWIALVIFVKRDRGSKNKKNGCSL